MNIRRLKKEIYASEKQLIYYEQELSKNLTNALLSFSVVSTLLYFTSPQWKTKFFSLLKRVVEINIPEILLLINKFL